jgi:hypothetical protein
MRRRLAVKQSNDGSNAVGYGKPPKATRFRKGQSGNPKGRPKGKLNLATVILRALGAKVVINENGRRREVTKLEAAMMQLVNKAATGDLRALDLATGLAQMAEERVEQGQSKKPGFEDVDRWVLEGLKERLEAAPEGGNEDETDRERKKG